MAKETVGKSRAGSPAKTVPPVDTNHAALDMPAPMTDDFDAAVMHTPQFQRQILRMQATLGNTFVRNWLSPKRIQCAWSDAKKGGWNAGERLVGAMRRIPIEGLKLGNQEAGSKKGDNPVNTSESAAGKAVVVIPQGIDPAKPIEVLFHLHGHEVGYRQQSNGTVNDVDVHRIEQQLQAVTMQGPPQADGQPTLSRQMIAVLPQLGTASQFGKNTQAEAYLTEVFQKLNAMQVWGAGVAGPTSAQSVVMSAHSGGGGRVRDMLNDPTKIVKNLHELILFDAINGDAQLSSVQNWLLKKLDAEKGDIDAIAQSGASAAEIATQQLQRAQSGFIFRGYYSFRHDYYEPRYVKLGAALDGWFNTHKAALGGEQAPVYQQLRDNFQIIKPSAGTNHSNIVRQNDALQHALSSKRGGAAPVPTPKKKTLPPPPPPPPNPGKLTGEQWDTNASKSLEGFLESFQNIPVTVKWTQNEKEMSKVVHVHPPYFINKNTGASKARYDKAHENRQNATGEEANLAQKGGGHKGALVGKSTPEDIQDILQQAADKHLIPSQTGALHPDAADMRAWLVKYGIGVDCSGFVSQALNKMMGDAGGTDLLNIYNTGSKQMQGGSSDRFKKIDNPHQTGALRPGDTLHTEGHIRIVTRVGANSDGNAKFMTAESSSASDDVGPVARVWRFQGAQLQRERSGNWEDSTANRWTNYTETVTFGRYRGVEKLREEQTQHDLPPPPKPVERPMLRRGDRGSDVSDLQDMLNARPMIEPKLNVDGVFGKKTDAAVRQFQKTEHLSVDGIVGPRTWGALLNSPSPKPKPTPNGDLPPAPNPMAQRVKPGTAGKHEGVGNYVVYQDEVRTGGTLAWRNTNPGNIIRGQFATAHGAIGYNNRFAVFPDEATGMAAIVALLRTPKYQALTVLDAMKRYAPPEDNNDPVAYANHIHQLTGIEPSRAMSSLSDAELEAMAGAIRKVEGWKEGTIYRRGRGSPAWVAPLLGSE